MSRKVLPSPAELAELDRFYREGGLREMASPHVHYADGVCPHGCGHKLEWIDFQLELLGDPEGIYKPLVQSWWQGIGFVGACPNCGEWIRFRTIGMEALDQPTDPIPLLPSDWHTVAQFG